MRIHGGNKEQIMLFGYMSIRSRFNRLNPRVNTLIFISTSLFLKVFKDALLVSVFKCLPRVKNYKSFSFIEDSYNGI